MAKRGQHKRDAHDPRVSRGRNNPKESVPITAGTPKKQETYEQQARERRDTDPEPQRSEPRWVEDTRDPLADEHRAHHSRNSRSGSDSNADRGSQGH
ncbi:MAG: hypothetical protein IT303_17235 [Dehalococcoidia bacterium]|nr:hypothetical protein [Dehalococcoidia bacterium]